MPNRGDYQFLFFGCLLKKMIDYRFKIRILRMRVWSICDQYVCVWFEPGPNHIGNHKHHFINHIKQQTNKQQSYLEEREKETTIFENDIWERPKWTTTTTTTTNYHHQRSSFFDVQKQRKHYILKQTDRQRDRDSYWLCNNQNQNILITWTKREKWKNLTNESLRVTCVCHTQNYLTFHFFLSLSSLKRTHIIIIIIIKGQSGG